MYIIYIIYLISSRQKIKKNDICFLQKHPPSVGGSLVWQFSILSGFFKHLHKFQDFVCLVGVLLFSPELFVRAVPFAEIADVVQ